MMGVGKNKSIFRLKLVILPLVFLLLLGDWGAVAKAQAPVRWEPTGGPSGGKINVLVVDPQNPSTIYAGTAGGVYVSHDGAATWKPARVGLPTGDFEVQALAIDPQRPKVLYAGLLGEGVGGVYKSVDGGRNWEPTATGRAMILCLTVATQDPQVVYAGTVYRVFRSTDGGETWMVLQRGIEEVIIWSLATDPRDARRVYAGTNQGVYHSTDGGWSWQRIDHGLPSDIRVQVLVIPPQSPDTIYAGTDRGVYRSTDGGGTWTAIGDGTWDTEAGSQSFIRALAVAPDNPLTIYAGASQKGLYRSTDGGENWVLLSTDFANYLILTLTIDPTDPGILYAGTSKGVHRSADGGRHWQPANQGLTSTVVRQVIVVPASECRDCPPTLYATTDLGIYRSDDEGMTWQSLGEGLAETRILALVADPRSPSTLYVGTWGGSIYRSTDRGKHWQQVTANVAQGVPVTALAMDPTSPGVIFAGTDGRGVFRTDDGGERWVPINSGLINLQVQTLVIVPTDPPLLYAGTGDGLFQLVPRPGENPEVSRWRRLKGGEVRSLVVDPEDPQILYVAMAAGTLFKSTDGGTTWDLIGQGELPADIEIRTLCLDPRRPQVLCVGTGGGVFRSEDGGAHWQVINEGLAPNADILTLAVSPSGPYTLYAGTNGGGVFKLVESLPTPKAGLWPWPWPLIALLGLTIFLLVAVPLTWRSWMYRRSPEMRQRALLARWPLWEAYIEEALMQTGRVEEDMVPAIPLRLRSDALQRYVQTHPDDDLIFYPDPPRIEVGAARHHMKAFLRNWKAAWETVEADAPFESIVSMLVDQLCDLLGFTIVDSRTYKHLHGFVVKAPALLLKVPPRFPIIFLQCREFSPSDIADLRDLMGILNMTSYFALLIDLNDNPERVERGKRLKWLVREVPHDFIVLDGTDLRRIILAKDHERRLIDIILQQVDLTVVSPYVTSGPVPENMFFGRDYELKTITRRIRDSSFALVGGRKIGKTSILAKVYRLLADTRDYFPLYLDCQSVRDYEAFFEAVSTMWEIHLPSHSPEHFRRLIAQRAKERIGETIVILLDEVDALLRYDTTQREGLFGVFRALSQQRYCRFVFCGERVLNSRLHAPDSPLFNFCDVLTLSYLDPPTTRRIILEPMESLGVRFADPEAAVQEIISLSSCHPNIVQYICQRLIVRINQRGTRLITPEDLEAVRRSSQFGEYFLEVMWGNTTPLERIITLLFLDDEEFTMAQIEERLAQEGVVAPSIMIEEAIEGLRLYSILEKQGQSYRFASQAFPRVVRETQDVKTLLDALKEQFRSSWPFM